MDGDQGEGMAIDHLSMTIGAFSVASGLTPKALRLYDERGVLVPATVDPVTGYRRYAPEQVRHGQVLWALRQAGVPLAELGDVDAFDVEAFRERRETARMVEDAALRMAEAYRGIRLADWPVRAVPARPRPWVGTRIDLPQHDDADPFAGVLALPGALGRHRAALAARLAERGNAGGGPWWTAADGGAAGDVRGVGMLVGVPAERDPRGDGWDALVADLRADLGDPGLTVVGGVLPARWEVVCTAEVDHGDERASMASSLAPRLAIDAHVRARGLRPLSPHPREVHHGDVATGDSGTVRDVAVPVDGAG